MLYTITENQIQRTDSRKELIRQQGELAIGIFSFKGSHTERIPDTVPEQLFYSLLESQAARFESHKDTDFMCIHLLDRSNKVSPYSIMYVYMQKNTMQFVCQNTEYIENIIKQMEADTTLPRTSGEILYLLFFELLKKEPSYLESLEKRITNFEDSVIEDKAHEYTKDIISLRKELLRLKRYYTRLYDVLVYINSNDNEILSEESVRLFRILKDKTNRLCEEIIHLRDYVTQIREAYQAHVDIKLNTTMKVFTVITAVFLPLSLIAGWYGMNLSMPEYSFPFAYPIVILISIFVVIINVWYFKKHKWF